MLNLHIVSPQLNALLKGKEIITLNYLGQTSFVSDRCSVLMAQIAGEELNCKWSCQFNSGAIQVFIMVNCLWQLTRPLQRSFGGRWFDSRVCVAICPFFTSRSRKRGDR